MRKGVKWDKPPMAVCLLIDLSQQYPPGTQNNYVVFLNLFVVTKTGKDRLYPKGGKGF
jgi:hypothetical protein